MFLKYLSSFFLSLLVSQLLFTNCATIIFNTAGSGMGYSYRRSPLVLKEIKKGTKCKAYLKKSNEVIEGIFGGFQYTSIDSFVQTEDSIFVRFIIPQSGLKSSEEYAGLFFGFDPEGFLIWEESDKMRSTKVDLISNLRNRENKIIDSENLNNAFEKNNFSSADFDVFINESMIPQADIEYVNVEERKSFSWGIVFPIALGSVLVTIFAI